MTKSTKMAPKRNLFIPNYEHKSQPLASSNIYYKRVLSNLFKTICILGASLMIGILGYKFLGPMSWIDALHNASMILSGMGPVVTIQTNAGKLFSSFYAIFSGVVFISSIGVLIAPTAHRFFHSMNLED
jgi:hypothetical protein